MSEQLKSLDTDKFADFAIEAMLEHNPKYNNAIARRQDIYKKDYDPRNPFERDSHRILHSNAYRRLKHKTQVFFATNNDHVCTRIEHVTHVASISGTIAKILNLNLELVNAIAIGHDLGHAPFGHQGEYALRDIVQKHSIQEKFWHEGNGLNFIDKIETLPDYNGNQQNLNLTYAVRDGIVCHCGEVDDINIKPREEFIDLYEIKNAGNINAYTYEGCIVKIADKIAYLGRDIEDALTYKILTDNQIIELEQIIQNAYPDIKLKDINTTFLMHYFILDLCTHSSIEKGLCFSSDCFKLMKLIKDFNYNNIYLHQRLQPFKNYVNLIINTIFEKLNEYYCDDVLGLLNKERQFYPTLTMHMEDWLIKYSNVDFSKKEKQKYNNEPVYNIKSQTEYQKSIIDFISGMSDRFAIKIFNEIISFSY